MIHPKEKITIDNHNHVKYSQDFQYSKAEMIDRSASFYH